MKNLAVSEGISPCTGTDTGGSVRTPAAYCGVFGYRPTHGIVSTTGVIPLAQGCDTVGNEHCSDYLLFVQISILFSPMCPLDFILLHFVLENIIYW